MTLARISRIVENRPRMSKTPEEVTIEVPPLRIAARVWGPSDGAPMLALHGWLDNAASFDGLAPLLSGVRLWCIDLPGHGLSSHVGPGELYGFLDTVARVHAVTRALGWERFGLLGHSLGAALSSILAGTVPDRIERVVLVEGLGPLSEDPKHAAQRLAKSIADEERRQGRAAPVYESQEDAAKRLRASVGRLSWESAITLVGRGLKEVPGGFTWRSDPRLRVPSRHRLVEEQVLAFLRAIDAPTLLVRGTEGSPFAPKLGSARLAAVRGIRRVELPGGHHLHLDDPDPVASAIQDFIARS